jgi:hypothetical protein
MSALIPALINLLMSGRGRGGGGGGGGGGGESSPLDKSNRYWMGQHISGNYADPFLRKLDSRRDGRDAGGVIPFSEHMINARPRQ